MKKSRRRSRSYARSKEAFFQKQSDRFLPTTNTPFFSATTIQAKLSIGQPGDAFEQEADHMANRVMQMDQAAAIQQTTAPAIQTKCAACEAEDKGAMPALQKRSNTTTGGAMVASPALSNSVQQSKGKGQAMPKSTLAFMSNAFGRDFSQVKIHTDHRAVQMNQALNAKAFTNGQDIYFNKGAYAPHSASGKKLLAHELTHVVQQQATQQASIQRECVDGAWAYEYDGCSLPAWLTGLAGIDKDNPAGGSDTYFAREDRQGACDRHDECYQTCNGDKKAKKQCDLAMYDDMKSTCDASQAPEKIKKRCLKWSKRYYLGLRFGGLPAWKGRQKEVCACKD